MGRLACFDLDNTLIDRDGAFLAWARWWVDRAGLAPVAVDWLVAHDNHGFAPRSEVFAAFESRFGSRIPVDAYDREHPLFTWVDQPVLDGLSALRSAGWRVVIITNGTVIQQTAKLEHTGLADAVDDYLISEAVGVRKPGAEIFALAAEATGAPLSHAWMVGDHPVHDIAGAHNAGLRTIHITSDVPAAEADHHVASVVAAFPLILDDQLSVQLRAARRTA